MPFHLVHNYRFIVIATFCAVLLWLPFVALSHNDGASYEEEKEGYLIDIGYDPESVHAKQRTRFDFFLYQEVDTNWDEVNISDVWVRITKEDKVYFAGGIMNPHFGAPGFLFMFPESGTYDVSVRYQNDDERIVETTFPISVLESQTTTTESEVVWYKDFPIRAGIGFVFGITSGLFAMYLYRRITKRHEE